MVQDQLPRKLAVILHADVVGYSRLAGENEDATHRLLKASLDLIAGQITAYHGRVINTAGDAVLAMFEAVVDGVSCAIAIQDALVLLNQDMPDNQKILFRIGVNLGDVIEDGGDIFGDGVNVAARLEGLADPGGICVSEQVYMAIGNKLALGSEDLGAQSVKNIAEPIKAYKIRLESGAEVPPPSTRSETPKPAPKRSKNIVAVALAGILAIGIGILAWLQPWQEREEPASVARMAFPLPDKPSIAVMAFDNLSGDPDQEYLSDGFGESIITGLSQFPEIFVVARQSTYSYKGKPVKTQQVAEELGVNYVLQGSVQRSEDRVRVTAQLIDAVSGRHLWAEQYDREWSDIFALQDDITQHIVANIGAFEGPIEEAARDRAKQKPPADLQAYDYLLLGRVHFFNVTMEENNKARELFEQAVELDPNYSQGHVWIAWTYFNESYYGWSDTPEASWDKALDHARKAMALDNSEADAHWILASILANTGQKPTVALDEYEQALALNPNSADLIAEYGWTLPKLGRAAEGVVAVERAMRLNPIHPDWYVEALIYTLYNAGRYEEAIAVGETITVRQLPTMLVLAGSHAQLGQLDDAQKFAERVLAINSDFSLRWWEDVEGFFYPEDRERYFDGLRKAGLPQDPLLGLPDKPSIAVLPFQNLGGDEEQRYFADGVTEDIITILSRFSELFVIAKRSSFRYRDKDVEISTIGEELGVQYVVEGSIRRTEDAMIITVQLVDTASETNVWSERYDRPQSDFFGVQEEILNNIVSTVADRVENVELRLAGQKGTGNLSAYDLVLRGYAEFPKWTQESFQQAREYFQRAIDLDPQYARAYSGIGFTHNIGFSRGWGNPQDSLEKARSMALRAIELDDQDNRPRVTLGWAYINAGDLDKGIAEIKKGISLNPNDADVLARSGYALTYYGEFQQAVDQAKRAMRINPFHPSYYYDVLAWAQYFLRQYDESIKTLENVSKPNRAHLLTLAAASARIGDQEKAESYAKEILDKDPAFNLEEYRQTRPFKHAGHIDFHVESLRMAGLP